MASLPKPMPAVCTSDADPALSGSETYIPLIECPADLPEELFDNAISQLIHRPEYNSTLVLRSEIISDNTDHPESSTSIPTLVNHHPSRFIRRKLLPRRPDRDTSLEQSSSSHTVLVLTPITSETDPLPYYHPRVSHLAFRYLPPHDSESSTTTGILRIEVVPLPNTLSDPNSRLYRTYLALLESDELSKREIHDMLVPREPYQDLYLIMRERHKGLVVAWQEVTDPLKHVFEPRPPAGFIDIGCGNGLLTRILTAEGYKGHGIDVRERMSWKSYPSNAQKHLHVHALDPLDFDQFFPQGVFVITHHAHEHTPCTPVLSTLCSASGYHILTLFPLPNTTSTLDDLMKSLILGEDSSNPNGYSMYRIWLATLSAHTGWEVESGTLRIPSTRNWAIIGLCLR
ncbi:hypothetical protein F5878DRAFT_691008 [Lentinula raphanica]|uniref:tRNA (uracil-O(2)-)-methyltransferase n=1 Tax=Lentinula raphanica TaxID=153919 RepID=A0AA38P467_9AGAR|nr:hypothetical protein F5878DRAFT_691008 [Lentinula raphanica]